MWRRSVLIQILWGIYGQSGYEMNLCVDYEDDDGMSEQNM